MPSDARAALLALPGVGLILLRQPYRTLGLAASTPHEALCAQLDASNHDPTDAPVDSLVVRDGARRLAWHALVARFWGVGPVLPAGTTLATSLDAVSAVLRALVRGRRRALDGMWPEAREMLAHALVAKASETKGALAGLATRLGIPERAASEVIQALRGELFPLLHLTILADLDDRPTASARDELHQAFLETPLAASEDGAWVADAAQVHSALRHSFGGDAQWNSNRLSAFVEVYAELPEEDRWWSRAAALALGRQLGTLVQQSRVNPQTVLLLSHRLAAAAPDCLHLRSTLARAAFLAARDPSSPPMLLARAAALAPGFPEPRKALQARLTMADDPKLVVEALGWLHSEAGREVEAAQETAAACELIGAAATNLPHAAVRMLAQLVIERGVADAVSSVPEHAAAILQRAFASARTPEEIVRLALGKPEPTLPRFGRLQASLFAGLQTARSSGFPRGPGTTRMVASMWLRSRRDLVVKAALLAGAVAVVAGLSLRGSRDRRTHEIEQDFASIEMAVQQGDARATRKAAAAFMRVSDPQHDATARSAVAKAWEEAIWRSTSTADSDQLKELAAEAAELGRYTQH